VEGIAVFWWGQQNQGIENTFVQLREVKSKIKALVKACYNVNVHDCYKRIKKLRFAGEFTARIVCHHLNKIGWLNEDQSSLYGKVHWNALTELFNVVKPRRTEELSVGKALTKNLLSVLEDYNPKVFGEEFPELQRDFEMRDIERLVFWQAKFTALLRNKEKDDEKRRNFLEFMELYGRRKFLEFLEREGEGESSLVEIKEERIV
jgi:hypothetical protein